MTHGDMSAGEPRRTTEPTVETVAMLGAGDSAYIAATPPARLLA
jgi:hypothetical protein